MKLYPVRHLAEGRENHIAFYATEIPRPGSSVDPETIVTLEGQPLPLSYIMCGVCGNTLEFSTFRGDTEPVEVEFDKE